MNAHLEKVYEICVIPNLDIGARLGRLPDGSIVPTGDRDTYEYWVGTTYYTAALMYRAGMIEEALNTAYGAYHPVYEVDSLAYWFNTPEAWWDGGIHPRPCATSSWEEDHAIAWAQQSTESQLDQRWSHPHQYQRPRAVWELMFEIKRDSTSYQCGDANSDGMIDIGDVVFLVNYLYKNGAPPDPFAAGDSNSDGILDLGDVVYLINYLFRGGSAPCAP
jgi:hypothetical protein